MAAGIEIPILQDVTVIVAVGTVSLLVCSRLRVPGILGYLVTGLLVGPNGLGLVTEVNNINMMAEVGVVLLLFTIGLEFSLQQLIALRRSAIGGGLLQVGLTVGIVAVIAILLGEHAGKSIFLGMIVALSSTAIVLKLLMENGDMESPHGRITTSVLIFQDIAIIPMMLITPMLVPGGSATITDIFYTLGKALAVVIVLFSVARFVVPKLLNRVTKTRSREIFLFSIILVCMLVAFVTNKAGLSLALGAFLAGMVVSETGYGYQALGNVIPFKDVFTGFFFVSIGMLIDLDIFAQSYVVIIVIAIAIILIKALAAGLVINLLGYPARTSINTGLTLAQVGEFSFILAATGYSIGLLTAHEQSMFVSISVLTMAATPFLMQYGDKLAVAVTKLPLPEKIKKGYLHQQNKKVKPMKDHIIIVGYGLAGRNIAKAATEAGISYNVIELNPNTVKVESDKGTPIFYGDASQEEILEHAKLHDARAILITGADYNSAKGIVENIHRLSPSIPIIIRTRFMTQALELRNLGASEVIVEEVEASIAILTSVLRHYSIPTEDIEALESEIRQNETKIEVKTVRRHGKKYKLNVKGIESGTITIPVDATISGKTIRDIDVRHKFHVNIIGIRTENILRVSPGANDVIKERDELIITGTSNNIAEFANFIESSKIEHE